MEAALLSTIRAVTRGELRREIQERVESRLHAEIPAYAPAWALAVGLMMIAVVGSFQSAMCCDAVAAPAYANHTIVLMQLCAHESHKSSFATCVAVAFWLVTERCYVRGKIREAQIEMEEEMRLFGEMEQKNKDADFYASIP